MRSAPNYTTLRHQQAFQVEFANDERSRSTHTGLRANSTNGALGELTLPKENLSHAYFHQTTVFLTPL